MNTGKPIRIAVEAINKAQNLMIIDGEVCPITCWLDDEGEEIPTHEGAVGLIVKVKNGFVPIFLNEVDDLENQATH